MSEKKNQIKLKKIDPTPFVFNKNQESRLGIGAYGEVFLGFNSKDNIPVAIKAINLKRLQENHQNVPGMVDKLKNQIINMQIASGDHLVRLYAAHQSTRNVYLMCEYCNGGSLKDYIKNKIYLTEPQAMSFFRQLLKGFSILNERKIVHRDLKPANILLHNSKIKIGDLGFSKTVQMHEQLLESMVGSPMYMSPQILFNQKYTQKTDIWSLGIILYEMLYGDCPWKIANSFQDLRQKVKKNIEFPNIYTSKQIKQLLRSMLQFQQKERIGWQQLFNHFLSKNSSQKMTDQKEEEKAKIWQKFCVHFEKAIYVEKQEQIISFLIENNLQYIEMTGNQQHAHEFFRYYYETKSNRQQFKPLIEQLFEQRNRVGYILVILIKASQLYNQHKIPLFLELIFFILRSALNTHHNLMEEYGGKKLSEKFMKSAFLVNYKTFIEHQFIMIKEFYQWFVEDVLKRQLNEQNGMSLEVIKNIKGHFNTELIGQENLIRYKLKNSVCTTINFFKKQKQIFQTKIHQNNNYNIMLFSKMLFEFKNNKNMYNNKNSTLKLIQEWKNPKKLQNWQKQLNSMNYLQIQSLGSFINKSMGWENRQIPFQNLSLQ